MAAELLSPIDPRSIYLRRLPLPVLRFKVDIPLGKAIVDNSEISGDADTVAGLIDMKNELKHGPGLIFDAHRLKSGLDILSSGAQILKVLEPAIALVPTAASFYYSEKGFFPHVVKAIQENPGMKLIVVYREEDRGDVERKDAVQNVSRDKMNSANLRYMRRMQREMVGPNTIGFVAPYGSRRTYWDRNKIRRGAIRLSQYGYPVLLTLSRFNRSTGRFRMFASENVMRFSPTISEDEIRDQIHSGFQELNWRAGIKA